MIAILAAALIALTPIPAVAAQATYATPTTGPMSFGTFVSSYLNPALAAILSNNSGATAPAVSGQPGAYQWWVDTSSNPKLLKVYDGASWLTLASIDASGHVLTLNSSQLSGLSSGMLSFLQTASSANLRATLTDESGTGAAYFQGGDLGTPSAGVGTNLTGVPIGSGISGLGTGFATFAATPSSANLRATLTDESGTGAAYFQGGDLGTPSAGIGTNLTGIPIGSGISGLGTGFATFAATPSSANLRATLTDETGTGSAYFQGGDLGTPSAGVGTNLTGIPIATGITGSSANLRTALSDETGTGADYFQGGDLGTPSAGNAANITNLQAANLSGQVSLAHGGTGQSSAAAARGASGLNVFGRSTFGDANYTILATDRTVDTTTTFTAVRTATLPAASSVNPDDPIDVRDHAGAINGSNTLTIAAAGTDTINGASSVSIGTQYGGLVFKSDGVSSWHAVITAGGGGGSGTVTGITAGTGLSGGTITTSGTIALAGIGAHTYLGNNSGSSAVPSAVSATNLGTDLAGLVAVPDRDRQNALLGCADMSKALAVAIRRIETYCDGFKNTDGVNAGASVNYTLVTASGYVAPTAGTSTSSYANSGGTGNRTSSITVGSSGLSFGGGSVTNALVNGNQSDQVFFGTNTTQTGYIQFDFGSGNAKYIDEVKIYKDTGSGGLGTNWKWQGSNDGSTFTDLTGSLTLTGSSSTYTTTIPAYNATYRYFRFAITAGTFGGSWVYEFEFKLSAAAPGVNNVAVVSSTQTADATVTGGRVLAEIDPIDSITLNTDLIAKLTCDSGVHWTTGTLSTVGKGQSGRTVVETSDTTCGTSGTGFAGWIGTANNKNVNFYKLTEAMH